MPAGGEDSALAADEMSWMPVLSDGENLDAAGYVQIAFG